MFSFIFKFFSQNEYSIKFKSQITGFIIKLISTVVQQYLLPYFLLLMLFCCLRVVLLLSWILQWVDSLFEQFDV